MTATIRFDAITEFKIGFIEHLILNGVGCSDAVPIPVQYDDGRNPWRGMAMMELHEDGIIAPAGAVNSKRDSRNGSLLRWWRLVNVANAKAYLQHLRDAARNRQSADLGGLFDA